MSKTINTVKATAIFAGFGLKAVNTELEARKVATSKDIQVGATMLAMGVRSLDEFAATVVNLTEGNVDPETLQAHMTKAFPQHKIGDRHGSHYLSLARNGNLNLNGGWGCRFQPAKAARKARAKGSISIDVKSLSKKQKAELAKAMPELAEAILTASEE